MATFFLDSIDELKLTLGSFERALKRLKKCIGNRLHRVRVVITTRPIPFDEQLVRSVLPVPPAPSSEPEEEAFAKVAMREPQEQHGNKSKNQSADWRSVALLPLSDEQIVDFCRRQGVSDPDLLFEDLRRRNALEPSALTSGLRPKPFLTPAQRAQLDYLALPRTTRRSAQPRRLEKHAATI